MRDVRRYRSVAVSVLLVLAAGSAGVATASVLLGDGHQAAPEAVPGSQSAEGRADDPRGGLPFGVLVWRDEAGRTCAALGRRAGDAITDAGGKREYAIGDGGGCVDRDTLAGDLDVRRSGEHGTPQGQGFAPLTVIWGLARPGITEVQVRADRSVRFAKVTARGAFVTTFPGAITTQLDIVALSDDGGRRTSTFPAAPAEIRDRILHPRSAEESRRELQRQQDAHPEP